MANPQDPFFDDAGEPVGIAEGDRMPRAVQGGPVAPSTAREYGRPMQYQSPFTGITREEQNYALKDRYSPQNQLDAIERRKPVTRTQEFKDLYSELKDLRTGQYERDLAMRNAGVGKDDFHARMDRIATGNRFRREDEAFSKGLIDAYSQVGAAKQNRDQLNYTDRADAEKLLAGLGERNLLGAGYARSADMTDDRTRESNAFARTAAYAAALERFGPEMAQYLYGNPLQEGPGAPGAPAGPPQIGGSLAQERDVLAQAAETGRVQALINQGVDPQVAARAVNPQGRAYQDVQRAKGLELQDLIRTKSGEPLPTDATGVYKLKGYREGTNPNPYDAAIDPINRFANSPGMIQGALRWLLGTSSNIGRGYGMLYNKAVEPFNPNLRIPIPAPYPILERGAGQGEEIFVGPDGQEIRVPTARMTEAERRRIATEGLDFGDPFNVR